MYRHISKKHPNIELIYWTGDLPPHDIWNQTRQGNLEVLRETSKQLRQHFPEKIILPALGNHESVPVDSFPPPFVHGEHSISWLYSALNQEWTQWIGAGHGPTLRYGGYYSVNTGPGLRVISLNMNYCMNKNIWLLMNSTDPAEELKWLVYELQLAEFKGEKVFGSLFIFNTHPVFDAKLDICFMLIIIFFNKVLILGEKVHIIGHIPPGHVDCVEVWSRNYNRN